MSILPLILATGYFISWPSPRDPNKTITAYDSYPMADPILSPRQQIADRIFMERPMLDRMPAGNIYDEVAGRYPVREVVPRSQRQTMSTEDALALESYQTGQLARETDIREGLLRQEIARKQFNDRNAVIDQTTAALPIVGRIDPAAPDFDAQVAEIYETYPLAQQDPGFRDMVGTLAGRRNQIVQNQEIRDRNLQEHSLRQVVRGDAEDTAIDANAAQLGSRAYQTYQDELTKSGDRTLAYALAVTQSAQDEATLKRQQEENKPLTRSDYVSYSRQLQALLTNPSTRLSISPEDLSAADRAEYDFLRSEMQRYAQQRQGYQSYQTAAPTSSSAPSGSAAPAPTPSQGTPLPIRSLFPKSSTQTQGSGS